MSGNLNRAGQVLQLRKFFGTGATRPLEWRKSQLEGLKKFLTEKSDAIDAALWSDLRKGHFEAVLTEQGFVIAEIDYILPRLSEWMESEWASTPMVNLPGSSRIYPEPLGVVLIIGAWNYPVNLLLAPLVGALAAGNAVVLKPSELAPATSALIARELPQYLSPEALLVMEGGIPETQEILDIPFDLIFFTGSGAVGKVVMTKAAQHLTPVVLELGGKSPTLVLADCNIKVAARRIAWGKFMNAGQTCIAPDYLLVESSVEEKFFEALKESVREFYGEDAQKSPDYCRIVNSRNFDRLSGLIPKDLVAYGGRLDEKDRYIEPTLLRKVVGDEALMKEEIFGPILPIIPIENLEAGIQFINQRPKPLALYLFTSTEAHRKKVIEMTSSGGVCLNDVVMHMPVPGLPFGGVGASGMGHYHGRRSFDAFTHFKGVLAKTTWPDIPVRYAPYSESKLKWVRRLQ
jgi:aldehyde dehydrogenase (NAD+)